MAIPKKTTMAQREPPTETMPGEIPTFKVQIQTEPVDGADEGVEEDTEVVVEETPSKKKKGGKGVMIAVAAGAAVLLMMKK